MALLPCYLEENPAAFSLNGAWILWSDGKTLHTANLGKFTYTKNNG